MSETTLPIYFSNANFGPRALFTSPERIGAFAAEAGFDGVEIVPLRYSAERYARAIRKADLVIGSLHQGFRTSNEEINTCAMVGETGLNRTDRLMRLPILGPLLIGPDMQGSADFMAAVQAKTEMHVPGTFYPQQDQERDRQNLLVASTTEKLFQPTDHVTRLIGASSVQDMLDKLMGRGYTGVVFDTFHARRKYVNTPETVSHIEVSLGQLLPAIKALHISLGRTEYNGSQPHIHTMRELQKALRGEFNGELGEMLEEIRTKRRPNLQYIVLESTMGSVGKAANVKQRADLVKAYADIAENVRGFFAQAS